MEVFEMFKKTLISGILFGLAGLCLAKGTETAIGTKTIEPTLVFEYKFDGLIREVIFDTATMTVKEARALGMKGLEQRKATEKIKVQYPKVVAAHKGWDDPEGEVIWLDKNYHVKRKIQLGGGTYSTFSQNYVGIDKILSRGEKGVVTSSQFCLYDSEGERILEKKFDEYRLFIIANNGNFTSYQGDEGWGSYLFFYDSKGNLLKKVMPFENEKEYFSPMGVYSKSGKYIVMSFHFPGAIILFDYKGNEIWRKRLTSGSDTDQLVFSPDEKYIYTSGSFYSKNEDKEIEYAHLFDIKGNELPKDLKERLLFEEDQKKRVDEGFLYLIKENKFQIFKER